MLVRMLIAFSIVKRFLSMASDDKTLSLNSKCVRIINEFDRWLMLQVLHYGLPRGDLPTLNDEFRDYFATTRTAKVAVEKPISEETFAVFERYSELLRRSWLNPSYTPWHQDVCDFEHEHEAMLRPYFRMWQDSNSKG